DPVYPGKTQAGGNPAAAGLPDAGFLKFIKSRGTEKNQSKHNQEIQFRVKLQPSVFRCFFIFLSPASISGIKTRSKNHAHQGIYPAHGA
ncbi:MAG: hypothetical protein JXR29_05805, partial [Methylothermaceae bacterium]|nr:hypothetical protein [Methylothermaceae bacterium]